MTTENLSTLKIHKLTQEQYDRELAAGRIDENAIYLTPDEDYDIDLEGYATIEQLNEKENKIFKRPDEPLDAYTGALWIDTDEDPVDDSSDGSDIIDISISWNDLKDKPFYEEGRQIISWDGNTEGLESFTDPGGVTHYRVSDVTPELEELQNHQVTIYNNGSYETAQVAIQEGNDLIVLGVVVDVVYRDNTNDFYGVNIPKAGVYFTKWSSNIYTTSLVYGSITVKPLDEKFIPETIARISDIPTDYLKEVPEDVARKSDIPTDYLKEVPSEYITETELEQAIKLKNLVDGEGQNSIKSVGATSASGEYSFAEGPETMATGYASHAEGSATAASGDFSHAEGQNTRALGQNSHAEGQNTYADGADSHVQGRYNVRDGSNLYAHIVGNGTADTRANIHTVDWQGNAWFAGDVYVKSTSGINKDTGSRKLVSAPKSLTSGDLLIHDGSDWAKIAKSDLIADVIAALPPAEEAKF